MKLNPSELEKRFSNIASGYSKVNVIQKHIGERLIERIDYLKFDPTFILDLGCADAFFTQKLKKNMPKANVIGCDLSLDMLSLAPKRWFKRTPYVCCEMHAPPFKPKTFDLVFANLLLHWSHDYKHLLKVIRRILKPEGVFLFSTLGPDTFLEIKKAWQDVDSYEHALDFSDMHDIGDALMTSGFDAPVVDRSMVKVRYSSVKRLSQELKAQGVSGVVCRNGRPGLTGKNAWHAFERNYQALFGEGGKLPLTYEVIFGHAFRKNMTQQANGEVTVSIDALKKL